MKPVALNEGRSRNWGEYVVELSLSSVMVAVEGLKSLYLRLEHVSCQKSPDLQQCHCRPSSELRPPEVPKGESGTAQYFDRGVEAGVDPLCS